MKALLCMDPFKDQVQDFLPALQCLRHLGFGHPRGQQSVESVFVACAGHASLRLALSEPAKERLDAFPRRRLQALVRQIWGKASLPACHILTEKSRSEKKAARRLEKFSRTQETALLTVLKSEKKGLTRGLLGSFAESLIDVSQQNVLVVPAKASLSSRWQRVLFPTDLGTTDLEIFKDLAVWAQRRKIELCLFHVPDPLLVFPTDLKNPQVRREVERAQNELEKAGQRFLQEAPKGLRLHTKISDEAEDIPSQILREARRQKTDLLIMSSKQGRLEEIFLGSIAKTVLRNSKWPVLVARNLEFLAKSSSPAKRR